LAGSAAGSAGFSATAPSPDSLRFGSSAGASTTFVGEALPSTEVLAFLAATTGSAAAGAALVFSARAGDDIACDGARRLRGRGVDGVAKSICALARTACGGGRRFVTCAGNEVKKQRTARRRLRASRGGARARRHRARAARL